MRPPDLRWLIVFACNLLLLWLAGLANNTLAHFSFLAIDHVSLHLYVGGLLVTFSGLRLDPRQGFFAVIATGLAADALAPVTFGTSLVLFTTVYATILHGRHRFPREEAVFAIVVALLANLF